MLLRVTSPTPVTRPTTTVVTTHFTNEGKRKPKLYHNTVSKVLFFTLTSVLRFAKRVGMIQVRRMREETESR